MHGRSLRDDGFTTEDTQADLVRFLGGMDSAPIDEAKKTANLKEEARSNIQHLVQHALKAWEHDLHPLKYINDQAKRVDAFMQQQLQAFETMTEEDHKLISIHGDSSASTFSSTRKWGASIDSQTGHVLVPEIHVSISGACCSRLAEKWFGG